MSKQLQLQIQLLNGFQIKADGEALDGFHQPRLQALLAYLLLNRGTPQSRRQIAFHFWPDSAEKQARTNLRGLLLSLRRTLPDDETYLDQTSESVRWIEDAPYSLDVATFESAVAEAQDVDQRSAKQAALQQAIDAYTGELLPGFYDEWILVERERLANLYQAALTQLAELYEEEREYPVALALTQTLLAQDPLSEVAHQRLIHLYLLNEDRAAALRAYHDCATLLREELGVDPGPAIEELHMRLLRLEDEPESRRMMASSVAIPLVGRQAEWKPLSASWQQVQQGGPQLVLIEGEAGIGKTRLAEELVDIVQRQGMVALHSRAYSAEGAAAYAPVVELLRSAPVQRQLPSLDEVWLSELARLLPELLSEHPKLSAPTPMTDAWQRRRFQEAMVRGCLVAGQPLLLHIDDLQWCDGESLAWLHELLRFDRESCLLVVGTVRTGEADAAHPLHQLQSDLVRNDQCQVIPLGPLTPEEVSELAAAVRQAETSAVDSEQLFANSEGNPLFVVEMARANDESAESDAGSSASVETFSLPPKVHAVLRSRLGQLSANAQQLINLAAVIGRSFSYDLLVAASQQDEDSVVESIDELWERQLIREQGAESYDFSHDRIRDVAYGEISRTRKRLLHRRVAEALELVYTDDLDEHCGTLAEHFEFAGNIAKAIVYLQRAGERAVVHFASHAAIGYLSRALTLLQESDTTMRVELLLSREKIFYLLGRVDEQKGDLTALQNLIDIPDDQPAIIQPYAAHIYMRWAIWHAAAGDYTSALASAKSAIEQAKVCGDKTVEADALVRCGVVYFEQGKLPQAREVLQQALVTARAAAKPQREADALDWLSAVSMFTGGSFTEIMDYLQTAMSIWHTCNDIQGQMAIHHKIAFALIAQGEEGYEEARQHIRIGLSMSNRLNSQINDGMILRNLGWLYVFIGDYAKARDTLHQALAVLDETNLTFAATNYSYLGYLYLQSGDWKEAQSCLETSLDGFRTVEHTRPHRTVTLHYLSYLYSSLGEHDVALDYAKQALTAATPRGDLRHMATAQTCIGNSLLGLHRLDAATEHYLLARQHYLKVAQFNRGMEPLAGLAYIAQRQGQETQAMENANQILAHLQTHTLDRTEEALSVYLRCYHILHEQRDPRGSALLKDAYAQLQARAATINEPEQQRIFWEEMPRHREIRDTIEHAELEQ